MINDEHKLDRKLLITEGYPYFIYDPDGDGHSFFKTEAERDEYAVECIEAYRSLYDEEGWGSEVDGVYVGVVTARATQTDVEYPPPASELDEENCDSNGRHWPDGAEYFCNYKMMPLNSEAIANAAPAEPVAFVISFDGKYPKPAYIAYSGSEIDIEVGRIGGTAQKLPLYTAPISPDSRELEARPVDQWQPIETCPEDTYVLFWTGGEGGHVATGRMRRNVRRSGGYCQDLFWGGIAGAAPTHWMSVPGGPKQPSMEADRAGS